MSVNVLYSSHLLAYNSYMFKCSCKLSECFNNHVVYFNNLLACTC